MQARMSAAEHYIEAEKLVESAEEAAGNDMESFGEYVELARLHTELSVAHSMVFNSELEEEDMRP